MFGLKLLDAIGLLVAMGGATAPLPHPTTARHAGQRDARQLVVVVTPAWDSLRGTLRRFARRSARGRWEQVGRATPVVVGVNGIAWGADSLGRARDPHKREGDGRAPAGAYSLDAAFGFAPATGPEWLRLPYHPIGDDTECVDDVHSTRYNRIVERDAARDVDWRSSERMRRIEQYRLGAVVGYNARPVRRGRGSCIFLHIWADAHTGTAGCTAMPAGDLEALLHWLDPRENPVLVQLTAAEYARLRGRWRLP